MRINHNSSALGILFRLRNINNSISKNNEKLASGFRINRAADDAAGLSISEKMRTQIRGLLQVERNIQDGISLVQTADGAIGEVTAMLERMTELAVQAANDTYNEKDRMAIQKEINSLVDEIDSIASNTEFNGIKLLNGDTKFNSNEEPKSFFYANGGQKYTVEDGWVQVGGNGAKIKLNPGEKVIDDFNDWKFTSLQLYADIDSTGAYGLNVMSIPDGFVIVHRYPDTTFSYNGMTFDVTDVLNTSGGTGGNQHQANIVLSPGNNDGEVKNNTGGIKIQTGANANEYITLDMPNLKASTIGISSMNLSSVTGATNALNTINSALEKVLASRADLGAYQNRLEHTMRNTANYAENMISSESRIMDTDMAKELMEYTRNNILLQSTQTILAQANIEPQRVLNLLKQ
ncbi:flagellin [Paenibacillus alvei]|uniref:flagellin n=1 Tax=Paenibacillus alvei TaxID=44250 RepID=UPI002DDD1A7B|nr:flagellin [Paenibacillus alvei]